jgi:PleD family two-component response regulator
MNTRDQQDRKDDKTILVAVTDIFFYTKIRDALRPRGFLLERLRSQQEVDALAKAPDRGAAAQPVAMILNMNDPTLDAFRTLEQIKGQTCYRSLPILAFANHDEVETWRRAKELGVTKIVSRNEFSARTGDLLEELLGGQPVTRS